MILDIVKEQKYAFIVGFILCGVLFWQVTEKNTIQNSYDAYYATSTERIVFLEVELDSEISAHATTSESLANTRSILESVKQNYNLTVADRDRLARSLEDEKSKVLVATEQVNILTGEVTTLTKLKETDEELLAKYSKVFFLNENYVPAELSVIDPFYTYDEDREYEINVRVWPFLKNMLDSALAEGVTLWVKSAYRSFDEQAHLKGSYVVSYGNGANAFSADQGYSEHQLGTTVDFTTRGIGGTLEGIEGTPAFDWLTKNAHKYGFTLSYPENNEYYIYEPWHWRFVGRKLASDLYEKGIHFYDLDQRTIDEYLLTIFD